MKKQSKTLKTFGVRADETQVEEANLLGLHISEIFREALKRAIAEKYGKCPNCGHKKVRKA